MKKLRIQNLKEIKRSQAEWFQIATIKSHLSILLNLYLNQNFFKKLGQIIDILFLKKVPGGARTSKPVNEKIIFLLIFLSFEPSAEQPQ